MPKITQKSDLLPQAYLPLQKEARSKKINIVGARVNLPGIKSTGNEPFFFRFGRYEEDGLLNLRDVLQTFGTDGYKVAERAHKSIWEHLLADGAVGNFIVNADPNSVRIESDYCTVVNGDKGPVKGVTLKDCDGSFVFACEGLKSSFSPSSSFVSVFNSRFNRSAKTSAINSAFLFVDESGNSRFSKSGRPKYEVTGRLDVTGSPGSAFHRVYTSKVKDSPGFYGKRLDDVVVLGSKGGKLIDVSTTGIEGCDKIEATDCSDIGSITLSPFLVASKTHGIATIDRLPNREIIEGNVLPSGLRERMPWWLFGKAVPVLEKKSKATPSGLARTELLVDDDKAPKSIFD